MKKAIAGLLSGVVCCCAVQAAGLMERVKASRAAQTTQPREFRTAQGTSFLYRWHEPAACAPGRKYPLVVLLHGAGERGSNNLSQLVWGAIPIFDYFHKRGEEFFFVAGQVPAGQLWVNVPWTTADHRLPPAPSAAMGNLIALLAEIREKNPAVDLDRLYVTGVSMGGYGTWDLISRRPSWFAAAMPVCGGGDVEQAVALRDLPIFIHHGARDGAVPVWRGRSMIAALRSAGSAVARYAEYPSYGHDSWRPAYEEEANLAWLFSKRRVAPGAWSAVPSQAPQAAAPSRFYEVSFLFSTDGGESWRRGLVRRVDGFPLTLVDDRVRTEPGYAFSHLRDNTWRLAAAEGGSVRFRDVAQRPLALP